MVCSVALQGVKEAMGQVRDKSDYNYPQLADYPSDFTAYGGGHRMKGTA